MLGISGAGVNLNNQSGHRVMTRYPRIARSTAPNFVSTSTSQASADHPSSASAQFQDGFKKSPSFSDLGKASAGVYYKPSPTDAEENAPTQESARAEEAGADTESKSAAETAQEEECQTCKERRYQDGSDDPGVSFKVPGKIAKSVAASAIRAHEREHVTRNAAEAQREDREVISSSVVLHTGICPECGELYYSGGTTRTVTAAAYSNTMDSAADFHGRRVLDLNV